jgi:hypothetical protein
MNTRSVPPPTDDYHRAPGNPSSSRRHNGAACSIRDRNSSRCASARSARRPSARASMKNRTAQNNNSPVTPPTPAETPSPEPHPDPPVPVSPPQMRTQNRKRCGRPAPGREPSSWTTAAAASHAQPTHPAQAPRTRAATPPSPTPPSPPQQPQPSRPDPPTPPQTARSSTADDQPHPPQPIRTLMSDILPDPQDKRVYERRSPIRPAMGPAREGVVGGRIEGTPGGAGRPDRLQRPKVKRGCIDVYTPHATTYAALNPLSLLRRSTRGKHAHKRPVFRLPWNRVLWVAGRPVRGVTRLHVRRG